MVRQCGLTSSTAAATETVCFPVSVVYPERLRVGSSPSRCATAARRIFGMICWRAASKIKSAKREERMIRHIDESYSEFLERRRAYEKARRENRTPAQVKAEQAYRKALDAKDRKAGETPAQYLARKRRQSGGRKR